MRVNQELESHVLQLYAEIEELKAKVSKANRGNTSLVDVYVC